MQRIQRANGRLVASSVALAILISALTWYSRCPNEESACNIFTEGSTSLIGFVRGYLSKEDKLFNDPTTGDWLICFQVAPVMIDTRYDMYPKLFCEDIFACVYGAPRALKYIDSYHTSHLLVRDDFTVICTNLAKSQDWSLICDDGTLSFWGRTEASEADRMKLARVSDELIRNSELKGNLLDMTIKRRTYKYLQMAKNCSSSSALTAIVILKKALALAPDSNEIKSELAKYSNR